VAAVVLAAWPAAAGASNRCDATIPGWAGSSPMLGGESVVSEGEFVHQDFLYDDQGAVVGDASSRRNDANLRGDTNKPGMGTYQYPTDEARYGVNAADISQFRAKLDGTNVRFLVVLNTLLAPDSTVVGIALGDTGKTRKPWPLGAGIATAGTKHVITAWGTGAKFDGVPIAAVGGSVAESLQDNTIEVSVPLSRVGTRFRAYVAAGLWDTQRKSWMQVATTRTATEAGGGDGKHPNIFNVAFRRDEATTFLLDKPHFYNANWWWDVAQGRALADSNIDKYFADVDLDARDTPPREVTGYHQRIYCSEGKIAAPYEGIREKGVTAWEANPVAVWHVELLGPWQTYNVYVPKKHDRMTVLLHGAGATMVGMSTPGMQRDLGDANSAVLVDPLARGVAGGYTDHAEMAVLESMDDAQKQYGGDPSRTVLGGVSMGGLGTYRLLALHPDLFAGGVSWSGCASNPGYCQTLSQAPSDLFENYRDVQLFVNHDAEDWLLPVYMDVENAAHLETLGYPYKMAIYAEGEHTGFYFWDSWRLQGDFIRGLRIERNPVRVTYKTSEAWWRPKISPRLVYDHAYWVSGLRTRDTSKGDTAYGTVDATTKGLGRSEYTTAPMQPSASTGSEGKPAGCQFSGDAGKDFCMTHTLTGREKIAGEAAPRQNAFSATLTNLRATAFDLKRMGLSTGAPLVAQISTDGASEVRLVGTGPVKVAGASAVQRGNDVVLRLSAAGSYTVTLTRSGA
jgi:pimeloyl-ACP methyl ester carboxylesterase